MTLADMHALWGLLLVPALVIAFALDGQLRRRILARIGHLPQIRRMTQSLSLGRRRAKAVLAVTATALLVIAVGRPQRRGDAHMLPRRGLDIVVALDFSRSMLAADVYPSRLERAKAELNRLIDGLKGDRVGLVAFAGVTMSYPLTSDYSAAKLFWRDMQPDDIPVGGTNLGEAIRASLELFKFGHKQASGDKRPPAQVLLLLTDGADTENAALQAAGEAAAMGVKVYAIGIGSREGEVVVLKKKDDGTAEYVTDPLGTPVRMALDEATLKKIADQTHGAYFQLDPERFGVEGVQRAIAGLERKEDEGRVVHEPEEVYWWFLGAALALLLLESIVPERRKEARSSETAQAEPEEAARGGGAARLGGRRRLGAGSAAAALALLVPMLGGWTPFQRLSPDVAEGNERLAAGKAEEALAAFDRALATRPDDLSIHYNRGAALYALGKLPEAQREFQRAAETSDPTLRADALYNMGNAHLKQQQPKEAIDAYKRTLKLRPEDRRAKWNLELALRMLQQEQDKKNQQQQQNQQQQNQDQQKQEQQQQQDQQKQDPQQQNQDQQKQEQQQQQNENKQDQNDPKQQQGDNKQQQNENKPDQNDPKQQPRPQGEKPDEKQPDKKDDKGQSGASKQDPQQQQQQQPKPQGGAGSEGDKQDKPGEPQKAQGAIGRGTPRDIDRQDAEAVLDAFERVEPTVQKDLARRKAKNVRPRKDW